jgi:O-antigen/teichoic acid export membrane protein
MSNLATNVISNILGAGWLAVVQLVLVPLYVRLLGIEAYGLVGFYVTLQGVLKILEFGLSPTINRELARYSVRPDLAGEANDFTRTFELICWVMAAIIAIGVYLLAPWIAFRWLRGGSIPHETLLNSVRCMGLLAALQWPLTFYQSGLLGLQRQALLNITKSLMVTFTGLAGIAVLVQWERSIVLFFGSQVAATFLHVVTARTLLWRYLPASARRPGISLTRFAGVYRFAAGVSGITVCSLVITQADKVVLSKVLTLEQFGYYSLATVITTGFTAMNAPLFQALFPRFTALIAAGQEGAVRPLFRLLSQCLAVVAIPATLVISLFAFEIVQAWTGNPTIASNASPLVTVIILGSGLNSLMTLPYALQLSHGRTRIALGLNLVFAICIVPALLFAVDRHGAIGAAWVWTLTNLAYVLLGVPATHRLILGEAGGYWFRDVLAILGAAVVALAPWRLVPSTPASFPATVMILLGAGLTSVLAAGAVSGGIRDWLLQRYAQRTRGVV